MRTTLAGCLTMAMSPYDGETIKIYISSGGGYEMSCRYPQAWQPDEAPAECMLALTTHVGRSAADGLSPINPLCAGMAKILDAPLAAEINRRFGTRCKPSRRTAVAQAGNETRTFRQGKATAACYARATCRSVKNNHKHILI